MKFRFSIAGLMAMTLFSAVVIAAWRSASDLWANLVLNLTVAAMLVASFKARYARGPAGAWWFGFALLGWAHLLLGLSMLVRSWVDLEIPTHWAIWKLMEVLPNDRGVQPDFDPETVRVRFFILHNVTSLIVAWAGAVVVRFLVGRGKEEMILHITQRAAWEEAKASGSYRPESLAKEGFIHASRPEQVVRVANNFFKGQHGLVLLQIDPTKLKPTIREESPPESAETFPHIYGPLNLDAVVKVEPFEPGEDGLFRRK